MPDRTAVTANAAAMTAILRAIWKRRSGPEVESFAAVIERARAALSSEPEQIRPRAPAGYPGGLILLDHSEPTVLLPDLHARMQLLVAMLGYRPRATHTGRTTDLGARRVLDLLCDGAVQVVAVGDGVHAEGHAATRWRAALGEYQNDYRSHRHMDEEMRASFGAMKMVMELKCAFPAHFHFLKGNHDNIANERGHGNLPFGKFAEEGAMVERYVRQFYGAELLSSYYEFEKQLPMLAVGTNFVVSHAEPQTVFDRDHIIDYRNHPEVVLGLTWTDNDAAVDGSVRGMLDTLLGDSEATFHFGGHRPVAGLAQLRAGGLYVQFHNPGQLNIAFLPHDRDIDLDRDLVEIHGTRV
jgi:hypothetical protein